MLTYQKTIDWLFNQLPTYQIEGKVAYKADLSNAIKLADHLGNPQNNTCFIHVAGTNGKGSVSHMLSSVLQEAGYKVGLYTSPHLVDFRERIKINSKEISESYIIDFVSKNKSFFEEAQLSFFEMTVGLAFEYFEQNKVDIGIIEVGLGGRLDATNIINPLLSVITNIGLDHTAILGDTLSKIANEKAGIIKSNVPVVIGEYVPETKKVFEEKALDNTAPIFWTKASLDMNKSCDLLGDYQEANIRTAITAIRVLNETSSFVIANDHIDDGLAAVIPNTGLLGRWQKVHDEPCVVCDTAHNKEGLTIVCNQIVNQVYSKLYVVFGVVDDKNLKEILPLMPKKAYYVFTKPSISRGLSALELYNQAKVYGLVGEVCDTVELAYQRAKTLAEKEDFIFIGGSTFVVGDFLLKKNL